MLIEIKDSKQGEAAMRLLTANGIDSISTSAYKHAVQEYVEDSLRNMESSLVNTMPKEKFKKCVEYIAESIVDSSEDAFDKAFVEFIINPKISEPNKNGE